MTPMIPHRVSACSPFRAPFASGRPVGGFEPAVLPGSDGRFESIGARDSASGRSCAPSVLPIPDLNRLKVIVGLGKDDFSANAWLDVALREVYRRALARGFGYSFAEWAPSCRDSESLRRWAAAHGCEADFDLLQAPVIKSGETHRASEELGSLALPRDVLQILRRLLWTLDAAEARDGLREPVFDRRRVAETARHSLQRGVTALHALERIRSAPRENLPLLRLQRLIAVLSARPAGNDFSYKIHELAGGKDGGSGPFEGLETGAGLKARAEEIRRMAAALPPPQRERRERQWAGAFEVLRRSGSPSPEDFLRKVVALWRTPESQAFLEDSRCLLGMVPELGNRRLAEAQWDSGGDCRILFADPRLARGQEAQRSAWMAAAAVVLHEHAGHVARFRERGPGWHRGNLVASECEAFLIEIKHRLLAGDDFYLRYFGRYASQGWEWGLRNVIEETYVRNRRPPELVPPLFERWLK